MKTIKTTIAILALSIFTISCSKDDPAPTPVKLPSAEVSFENTLGKLIGDDSTVESNLEVTANGTILDLKKLIFEMNISHNNQKDLSFALITPDGTQSLFIKRAGGTGKYNGANKLRFSASFINTLSNGVGISFPAGNYKETQGADFATPVLLPIFSTFQNKSISGIWKLIALDGANNGTGGEIISWKLIFETGALKQ